ncbi:MAG: phosphoribosylanthranilate isomerase [Lachnospiraceae bacterium]|nr:phosphoribosylanthranilate isomerase [Lachnospiraceae bacterium]
MIKIKLCGLTRECDIEAANELKPEYIGFVFAKKSKRYVTPERAGILKGLLSDKIKAVGVFVNESPEVVADLLNKGTIDMAQLHGDEDENYITELRALTDKAIIKAFKVEKEEDLRLARISSANYILLDSGAGSGKTFNWDILKNVNRPFFLAGGLYPENVGEAVKKAMPYAVDVSSGIEKDGFKDKEKMTAFVEAIRKETSL